MIISDSYQTQKHKSKTAAENTSQISLFANDMHIHRVLLGLQWLKEADISQLQIVVTCKPCPPFGKPFKFALSFGSLNAAHHFPSLAMTLKNQHSALQWKTYIRVFSGEFLIIEGKGFQYWKVKTTEVLHRT
jgi:hypothetical protein